MIMVGLSRMELARLLSAVLPLAAAGDNDEPLLLEVGAVRGAGAGCVVFAETSATLRDALDSEAGAILAPADAESAPRVLRVADPRYAFALAARELARLAAARHLHAEPMVHPSAVVHSSAVLGARVRIGAGTTVGAGARLGDDVQLGRRVVVDDGVVLGCRVVVQAGAVLGSRGFGYVRNASTGEYLLFPQQGTLVIEDDVEIGANTTIDRGALEETRIGRGTKIDNLVHIGHNCQIGRNVVIAAQVGISGSCVVGDGAVLAGQVGISDHCHVGPGVILGGQAGVYRGKTVTGAGEIFAGTPAEPLREQMRSLATLRGLRRGRGGR